MNSIRVKGALLALGLSALTGPWALRVAGQDVDDLVVRRRSADTGRPTFAASRGAGVQVPDAATAGAEERALKFIERFGAPFGVSTRADLRLRRASPPDELGIEHVRFEQLHRGVPVTGSEIVVHLRGDRVVAVNGDLIDLFPASVTPAFPADAAVRSALTLIEKSRQGDAARVQFSDPRLEIVNRGRFESRRTDSQLSWFIEATGDGLREFIWVDAQTNEVAFHFSQLGRARNRQIHSAAGTDMLPGTLVRSEGQGPTGNADQDTAYDYSGSFYDYFFSTFGRDSYDNAGGVLRATTQYVTATNACPDLFWNGSQIVVCDGYGTSDDVIAHEFTHGLIRFEADLFAYGQSGAIAESLADIFGETIDQLNGLGSDSAGQKWAIGEDLAGGPIRHMMTPALFDDPGKMSDPMWCDLVNDHAGVHTNSGIPNHAYALMVDGGAFNGYTVTGIGLAKAAKVQYRAMTSYLTVNSTFADYVDAVSQSCTDLIGAGGLTAADCDQVDNAMLAVELGSQWGCRAPQPEPALCPAGGTPSYLFQDGFESGLGAWTVASTGPGGGTWTGLTSFPATGTVAAYGTDVQDISDHSLQMAASVALPAGARLAFDHFFEFEIDFLDDYFNFDGGVLEYSTNGGASWTDAGSLIDGGLAYGGVIDDGFENPLMNRMAFVGYQPSYRRTRLNLAALAGQNVRFRFRIGTDSSVPDFGWLVDNVGIYTCAVPGGAPTVSAGPQSQTVATGASVVFSVTASGTSLTYQWFKNGVAIPGATGSTLSLTNVQDTAAGSYGVVVSNSAGSASPDPALLTVIVPGGWGGETAANAGTASHPFNLTVAASGQSVTQIATEGEFNCGTFGAAAGVATPIAGNEFSFDNGAQACGVRIQARGSFHSAFSASGTAILTLDNSAPGCQIVCSGSRFVTWTAVAGAPTINVQPRDLATPEGQTAQFTVGATGTPAPTYQWQISTNGGGSWSNLANGAPYSGVTTATLTITGVTSGLDNNRYRAVATNSGGSAISTGALLQVTGGGPPPPGGEYTRGDFDADAMADPTVYRPGTGTWFVLKSSSGHQQAAAYNWGVSTDVPVPGDYDGDSITDVAVYRPGDGYWYVLTSSSGFAAFAVYSWGVSGDVAAPADYDGDGRTDIAVYRPSSGYWFVLTSESGFTAARFHAWGVSSDVPVPADYDGDSLADIAVFRPSSGTWFILKSTTSYTAASAYTWGQSGDVPTAADYDGDGTTDVAVYRPSSGVWFILTSSSGFSGALAYSWGVSTDEPVPADFDGDGTADIAVYRPSNGGWYILTSSSGFSAVLAYGWGTSTDVPVYRRP